VVDLSRGWLTMWFFFPNIPLVQLGLSDPDRRLGGCCCCFRFCSCFLWEGFLFIYLCVSIYIDIHTRTLPSSENISKNRSTKIYVFGINFRPNRLSFLDQLWLIYWIEWGIYKS